MNKLENAVVLKVIDPYTVVINKGSLHGISVGNEFTLYYELSEPFIDPFTGEDLGALEVPVGRGEATSVQEKITIIKSCLHSPSTKRIIENNHSALGILGGNIKTEFIPGELLPFDDIQVGYKVKSLK